MRSKSNLLPMLLFLFASFLISPSAARAATPEIPAPLEPWVGWALHGHEEELLCVSRFDNPDLRICSWPSELKIALDDSGGTFEQRWRVFSEGYLPLPGYHRQWPSEVRLGGEATAVIGRGGVPSVFAPPGEYRVTGRFRWTALPEYLQVPANAGLVSVSVNNRDIPFPAIDERGRIWLKRRQVSSATSSPRPPKR